ncbi:uncharacterized protein ARMOST_21308 [Armillaria ostoyae]|uniref:Uncharacterized protein n=1 Tax=Armillaria ostoyae TaxID=47428 RepID=A0A284S9P4_ARMOS|nr:uncharacterized protein ARMOST_21308 [Armillaria ostoyae]
MILESGRWVPTLAVHDIAERLLGYLLYIPVLMSLLTRVVVGSSSRVDPISERFYCKIGRYPISILIELRISPCKSEIDLNGYEVSSGDYASHAWTTRLTYAGVVTVVNARIPVLQYASFISVFRLIEMIFNSTLSFFWNTFIGQISEMIVATITVMFKFPRSEILPHGSAQAIWVSDYFHRKASRWTSSVNDLRLHLLPHVFDLLAEQMFQPPHISAN